MQSPLGFVISSLVLLCTPGPTNTLLAIAGAHRGLSSASSLIASEATGYLIAVSFWGLIAGPLMAHVPVVGISLRILLGLYLLHTAWSLWTGRGSGHSPAEPAMGPSRVFIATLCNPKGLIVALAIIPFGDPHAGLYLVSFVGLAAVAALGWICVGTALGTAARVNEKRHLITGTSATCVGAIAFVLMASPLFV